MKVIRCVALALAVVAGGMPAGAAQNGQASLRRCGLFQTSGIDRVQVTVCRDAKWNLAWGARADTVTFACISIGRGAEWIAGGCGSIPPEGFVDGGAGAAFDATIPARRHADGATGTLSARGFLFPAPATPEHDQAAEAGAGVAPFPAGGAGFSTNTRAAAGTFATVVTSSFDGAETPPVADGTPATLYTGPGASAGSYPF